MRARPTGLGGGLLAIGMAALVAACVATTEDVKTASRQSLEKTEEVRASLQGKIEEINRIQSQAKEQQAKLEELLKQSQHELRTAQQRNAELETRVQEIKGQDLSVVQGLLETIRRDLDGLQSGLDDQRAQVFALNQKLTGRLDDQAARLQEGFVTLGKKADERLESVDRRLEAGEKRVETTSRNLMQVTETVKVIGTKLSTQVEQQALALAKLEEATKQTDGQARDLSAKVTQFQAALSEFSKVLHSLNDRTTDMDRRVAELAGKTEGKVSMLAVQEGDRAAKLDALRRQVEADGQAMKSLAAQAEQQTARLAALEKTLNTVIATVNETSGSIGALKSNQEALKEAVGRLAVPVEAPQEASTAQQPQLPQPSQPAQQASIPAEPLRPSGSAPRTAPEAALSDKEAYDLAKAQYEKGQCYDALKLFRQFTDKYPHSATYVPAAHFYMAECYKKTSDYTRAIEEYEKVINNYPRHQKAPGALLHKAEVLLELGEKLPAKNTYKQVIDKYSGTEEAHKARNKLASLK